MDSPAQQLESERTKYPNMQVDEILVWRRWLQLHPFDFERFEYNVHFGVGLDPGPSFDDNIRKMAIYIRQLKIDAVGYKGVQATIFEVRRRAGPPEVGQLLTYWSVWQAQKLSLAPPKLRLVCAGVVSHILPLVQQSGIQLDVVEGINFSVLGPGRLIPSA